MVSTTEFNESEWFAFTQKLQVQESCDGVPDPEDACNPLDYKIEIQATSGSLRLALRKEDTLLLEEIMQ